MKIEKMYLILLIIFALTGGTLVGTALAAGDCTCDEEDCVKPCGDPGDDCCACGAARSECENCTPAQPNCHADYSMESVYDEDCEKWIPKYASTECKC